LESLPVKSTEDCRNQNSSLNRTPINGLLQDLRSHHQRLQRAPIFALKNREVPHSSVSLTSPSRVKQLYFIRSPRSKLAVMPKVLAAFSSGQLGSGGHFGNCTRFIGTTMY
ncbi:hypothetical protein RvY_01741, partial [Ramazzottius varieornatus]